MGEGAGQPVTHMYLYIKPGVDLSFICFDYVLAIKTNEHFEVLNIAAIYESTPCCCNSSRKFV